MQGRGVKDTNVVQADACIGIAMIVSLCEQNFTAALTVSLHVRLPDALGALSSGQTPMPSTIHVLLSLWTSKTHPPLLSLLLKIYISIQYIQLIIFYDVCYNGTTCPTIVNH